MFSEPIRSSEPNHPEPLQLSTPAPEESQSRWLVRREALCSELFPLPLDSRGKIVRLDETPELIDPFLNRLRNLPGPGQTAILCPLTGMERAAEFLTGFYEVVNPSCQVVPIDTSRFMHAPDMSGLETSRRDRVVYFDEECCHTYERVLPKLFDLGYHLNEIRRLRLNDAYTLHIGGDMCISRVKRSDSSESKALSEAMLEWRQGIGVGSYAQPNYGLYQALGVNQFFCRGPAPLEALRDLYQPSSTAAEIGALYEEALTRAGLPNGGSRTQIESILAAPELSSARREAWRGFQERMGGLDEKTFAEALALVRSFEEDRRSGFRRLGCELGERALALTGNNRFNLGSLPYHWTRPPDPFREGGS